jgi:hypothetical protein
MSNRDSQSIEPQWGNKAEQPSPSAGFQTPFFKQTESPPPSIAKSAERREKVQLSGELLSKGYHPVMLFGTRASGKSSLLASLFYYLQSDPESPAIAVLGEWIVPTETAYGQSVADAATRFFNHVVNNFHDGEAAPITQDEVPFYIPVILRPNNGQPEIKLAFLESKGEWYRIQRSSKDLFPELRDEVADVYQNYKYGISILLIAPYVIGEAYSEDGESEWAKSEMRDSDTALFGALQSYQMHRRDREMDRYLFVLTKWDARTRSIVDKEFTSPPRGLVSHLIAERFPKSWTLFQNMQSAEAESMQYSAGLMSGNARVEIPTHLKPIMSRYPKMLWRWLYSNATYGDELFVDGGRLRRTKTIETSGGLLSALRKLLT